VIAEWAALIAIAWRIWGVEDVPFTVEYQEGPYQAMATQWPASEPCRVWIDPDSDRYPPEERLGLMVHEAGHCLGLDHHPDGGVMTDGRFWKVPSPAERQALTDLIDSGAPWERRSYGFRAVMPGLASGS